MAPTVLICLLFKTGRPKWGWFILCFNVLQMLRMLATRGHWTIDLVVGVAAGLWLRKYPLIVDRAVADAVAGAVAMPSSTVCGEYCCNPKCVRGTELVEHV